MLLKMSCTLTLFNTHLVDVVVHLYINVILYLITLGEVVIKCCNVYKKYCQLKSQQEIYSSA